MIRLALVEGERREGAVCRPPYRVKNSSIGVLGAAASHLAAHDMRSLLRQAQEFARQWQELRAIHRSKLCGKLLRCPLEARPPTSLPAFLLVCHAFPAR